MSVGDSCVAKRISSHSVCEENAMETEAPNQAVLSHFFLEGLMYTAEHPGLFFLLFLLIYSIAWTGNLLILLTVGSEPHLCSPMYHFLGYLSSLDACLSTVTVPKVMAGLLLTVHGKVISSEGCAVQLYCFHFLASTECFLYALTAYDRYPAICQPLRYPGDMNRRMCAGLAGITWAIGAGHSAVHTALTFRLLYCGPHHIARFFCDMPPVLKLACADTTISELLTLSTSALWQQVSSLHHHTDVFSVAAVLRVRTAQGRQRAFSTCTSHLTVVLLNYMPPVCIYLQPRSAGAGAGAPVVFYTIVTPTLNPFIYTPRNKEVKRALQRLLRGGCRESPAHPLTCA
ncbi:olfactory receptor 10S1 [Puma concolor]|uniref:Olfactory receptor 10S1 n=1 Tax=Puma concolor TaxID=9696 RepID=A0A6P6IC58_PUMCO|nr:olfactory receptor 10S1 [Puma concolor]